MHLKFVIYRIIGNSLPPRHGPEDTYRNLQFALENEPDLPFCDKRWILNRLVDPEVEAKCSKLIRASGQKYHRIPFDEEAYTKTFLDASGMPKSLNPFAQASGKAEKQLLVQSKEWIFRHKSLVAINLNKARNTAIELGRKDAQWTLPLDGWCYFTAEGWDGFTENAARNNEALYGVIPLVRLKDNVELRTTAAPAELADEPQLVFRRDAPDRFYERLRYGNQNKSELLVRLGVPGVWENWRLAFWDTTPQLEATASGRFFVGGWAYRLESGATGNVETDDSSRYTARFEGVRRFVQQLDATLMEKSHTENRGHDFYVLQPGSVHCRTGEVEEILELADAVLAKPIRTVIEKTEMPPDCGRNDYHSLPPYMHQIGDKYIRIDGHLAAPNGSHDQNALHECFSHASLLAVSGVLCRRQDFLSRSAEILLAWFTDEDTVMNPGAQFAQWKPATPKSANIAGLIDFRHLWSLPHLSNTLRANGALSEPQLAALKQWAARFLDYIMQTNQGQRAIMAENNIGTWTHLLVVSLSLFTGNFATVSAQINSATLRLVAQCDVIGLQAMELARTRPLHYSLFNLTAWTLLANLGRAAGFDLWNYRGVEGQSICRMMHFIQNNMAHFQEYQDQPAKYEDWLDALVLLTPPAAADRSLLTQRSEDAGRNRADDPDLGLPSQWWYFLHRP